MKKKQNKLQLKLKKGAFTQYCKRKGYKSVTKACIEEGKKSKNPLTRKRAIFAETLKYKWKKR